MQVPRIRLSVEQTESDDLIDLGGEALALGAFVFYAIAVLFSNSCGLSDEVFEPALVVFGCTFAITGCGFAFFDTHVHHLFRRLAPLQIATVTVCLTAALPLAADFASEPIQMVLGVLAGCAAGVAAAVIMLYLGIAFARLDVHAIMLNTAAALLGAFALHAVVDALAPDMVMTLLGAASPLVLLAPMATRVTDRLPNHESRSAKYFHELKVKRGGLSVKMVVTFVAFGVALAFVVNNARYLYYDSALDELAYKLAATVAAVAVLFVGFGQVTTHDVTFNHVFRLLVPLLAVAMLPLAVAPHAGALLVVLLFDFVLCVGLAWGFLASISQQFRLSPVFVFGLGMGALAVGLVQLAPVTKIGVALCADLMSAPVFDTIACLFSLVVVSSFFPRGVDIHRVVSRSYDVAEVSGAATGDAAEKTAVEGGQPEVAGNMGGAGRGEAVEGAPGEAHKGRFIRRCELVADTFLLSSRETDVLILLAKGRNVGFIRENLCISEGTAKTHVHHVYKKLGVHSQQELIELVDSMGEA